MTKTSTLLSLILLTTAVGCAKTTDLGKMQEETIGVVKVYVGELDVLQRRFADLDSRRTLLGPLVTPEAAAKLKIASDAITKGRTTATSAPTTVAAAAKTGNAEKLTQEHDTIIETLEHEIRTARENIDAFETYAMTAETRPAAPPPQVPAHTNTDPNTPVSNDPHAGSGAPMGKMPAGTQPADHVTDIPCAAEIKLVCPDGQVDACEKTPPSATHACVPK